MFARFLTAVKALVGGAAIAANPVKGIATIVIGLIVPYLLYAFLGGAAFILIIVGIVALVWWLANRKK